jgi:hypothetical protein
MSLRKQCIPFAAIFGFGLLLGVGGANAATLIVNGGFETGDFTGWTTGPNSFPQFVVNSPINNGVWAAAIAGYARDPNTLSQTISDTAGHSYLLSF